MNAVVGTWTGRHAMALRLARRLTYDRFAEHLGTALRTVTKWNAEPDVVPVVELQAALDTLLAQSSDEQRARFVALLDADGHRRPGPDDLRAGPVAEITPDAQRRLTVDRDVARALAWLDDSAEWPVGESRRRVGERLAKLDVTTMADRADRRARVTQPEVASALEHYYGRAGHGLTAFAASCDGHRLEASVYAVSAWLDLHLPLGQGRDVLTFVAAERPAVRLDDVAAAAAIERLAEVVAADLRLVSAPLYRLLSLDASEHGIAGTVDEADFLSYALTVDQLENELIDALARGADVVPGTLPLRDRYLPDLAAVADVSKRLCVGGPPALCAIARPAGRGRRGDYLLLVQERSGRVLNAARRLAVIPKSFHEPLVDLAGDTEIRLTLEREMEEELFGREDVDTVVGELRTADPMHLSRLSVPMRWLIDHDASWRVECTGVGYNLVSGNYEFASLIVIEDERWWAEFGGHIEANWESDGLRRYSTLDREGVAALTRDPAWSNEGLFSLLLGIRRLSELGGERVNLPTIDLET